jgi:hypothetical protein
MKIFRVEQIASIALAPNDTLQQYMEDHESEIFMEERNEIDEILLRQPEMLKHNLPVEDLAPGESQACLGRRVTLRALESENYA